MEKKSRTLKWQLNLVLLLYIDKDNKKGRHIN